jgi:hypothetical protein
LRDNPLGLALAAFCGGLLLIALALGVVRSLPPQAAESGSDEAAPPDALDIPQLGGAEPIEAYAVIVERPVFNETRLPILDSEDGAEGEGDDELAGEDVEAPEVELAGVVITPELRLATLKPKGKGKQDSVVAIEGQPIEGDFGSWRVTQVSPREVTLASERGEEVQLKLQIHDEQIAPPPEPKPAPKEAAAEAEADEARDAGEQPLTRAEEIRQRIAERREELRRAAEEGRKREPPAPPQNEYQSVIQRMIGVRQAPSESEDEGDEQ